ncbi:VOC family protein [Streptomyces sp. NPDC060194]|uniref:VOC family protein n=1 Tax=Streptomyces sp. NPDC060194 TaxID=3347069 RepID=UPI0036495A56
MTLHWKIVIDAIDPRAQADFWAAALGYEVEDNSALIGHVLAAGGTTEDDLVEHHGRWTWRDLLAVRHPDDPVEDGTGRGLGRRILFQRVPEPKTVKNRVHLDLHPEPGTRDAEVERLVALGATVSYEVSEPSGQWVTLTDPEGNEFCVS